MAEEDGHLNNNASTSDAAAPAMEAEDSDENEEIILVNFTVAFLGKRRIFLSNSLSPFFFKNFLLHV